MEAREFDGVLEIAGGGDVIGPRGRPWSAVNMVGPPATEALRLNQQHRHLELLPHTASPPFSPTYSRRCPSGSGLRPQGYFLPPFILCQDQRSSAAIAAASRRPVLPYHHLLSLSRRPRCPHTRPLPTMPTFLGLAVSIHADSNPLPEYSIQKQSKYHRITSYIPVPPAKIPPGATKPEQSSFAISITLLTPGLHVPYSTPKPTPEEPNPKPKIVGGLPGQTGERGKYSPTIAPYKPLTTSPNETIAAYIYFDGRAKEEVATLLRRGEETWVNSRWVSVPESEGGGLAEREFLFREVGLERWLNGLDLEGKDKDVAAKIERRKQRLEKKRAKRREAMNSSDEEDKKPSTNGVLRYSESQDAPVETLSGNDEFFTTDSDSEDEPPMPEAAGQIKVALFRVLASGEIKRGEYSPQFDAHDDDEQNGGEGDDVDHTTSFAKPKTLDPKSISTQTVTGIDPPDKPYAVFTFLYRGERKLQNL